MDQFIIKNNKKEPTQYPVRHFYIDFRCMINNNIIRRDLEDSERIYPNKFTVFELHDLMNRIAKRYGNDLD